ANGSSTTPSAGVTRRTSHAMRSVGFTVGWLLTAFPPFLSLLTLPLLCLNSPPLNRLTCLGSPAISSPRQSLLRSFFEAFYDNSSGLTLACAILKYFE